MKVLVAQLNPTVGAFEKNTQKILKALKKAKEKKADIVLFPELSLSGYPPEDLLSHPAFIEIQKKCLEKIILASKDLLVFVGIARDNDSLKEKPLFNSCAIIRDGKLLGYYDKWLLPTYDIFDERRYFSAGTRLQVIDYKGKKIAVTICEDVWQHAGYTGNTDYKTDPIRELIPYKPDVMLNLSASPYQFLKSDVRIEVCSKVAKSLDCPVILCCQVGGNDQIVFDGFSVFVNRKGELISLGKGFQEDFMVCDLEKTSPVFHFVCDPIQDLYDALVLGVRDYFHKQHFSKACLGLSGGIDSAIVACIAVKALGKENVLGVCMPSRYTSKRSILDAKTLAKNLGIEYREIAIEKPFKAFLNILKPSFKGKKIDVSEENIQARSRGVILMALSNKLGYIVLSTGNKSEMALGYCTIYGDMCGGLSVISDVSKQKIYELSTLINQDEEIIPFSTIEREPSAELRPNQKDSDSLPDYAIIDTVLDAYLEEKLSVKQIAKQYKLSLKLVSDLVRRLHKTEYKRQQSAPCIRVTSQAFRVGWRYPIVQGWI